MTTETVPDVLRDFDAMAAECGGLEAATIHAMTLRLYVAHAREIESLRQRVEVAEAKLSRACGPHQKFPPGTRVMIAKDLGPMMSHFPSGKPATVIGSYTNTHDRTEKRHDQIYRLDIDGYGRASWYEEDQLSEIDAKSI